jgi:2Fe-2S ferredoxin
MPEITYILQNGAELVLPVACGTNLMQAAVDANINGIIGECGGAAMCATCHAYVESDPQNALGEMSPVENTMLDCTASERRVNSRLSCQLCVTAGCDGIRIGVPERQI